MALLVWGRFCHSRSRISLALVWITRDLYASVNNYDLSFLLGGGGGTLDYLLSVIFTFRDVLGDRDDANH